MLDWLSRLHAHLVHEPCYPLRTKYAKQIILKCKIETGRAWITLPACAAPQLIVYPPGLMPFSTKDVQAAKLSHTFTKHNICSSACHVSGNGDTPLFTCMCYDLCLSFMILGIKHLMGHPHLLENT